MKIKKTTKSRLNTTNFKDLPFGTVFSDHMFACNFKDGKWQEPEILPYGPISMNPGAKVLHYGQAIFEGMKAFKNSKNKLLIFRKVDYLKRLNKSAVRLSIPEIPRDIFINGLNELLSLDSDWCKFEDGYSLYVRPFIFASEEGIKASASSDYTFMIVTSPSKNYYAGEMNLLVEEYYTRASKGGVGFAKASGNYAASFYPTKQANAKGFQQVIWTDSIENKYIEESGTMNIWFRIGNKLITPSITDSILNGMTRNSIITLAKDSGIDVEEKRISVSEIISAYQNGDLKEVFGTGTAVAVLPVSSITYRDDRMNLISLENSYALTLKKKMQDIQKGKIKDVYGWTSKVSISVPCN